ncbi:hypothetical protein ACIXNK_04140 [Bacteroides fragilis]
MTNGLKRFSPYRRLKKRFIPVRSLIFLTAFRFGPGKVFLRSSLLHLQPGGN